MARGQGPVNRMSYRGAPGGGDIAGGPLQRARLALMNNQPDVAIDICQRRLEKKPDDTNTRLVLAQALIQMQRTREAVTEARRALKEQPNSTDALMLLASALAGTNQANPPQEAQDLAERAVQLQPRMARTHVQLAEILMVRKDFGRAVEEAEAAVKLEPRLAAAHLIKGMALLNNKDYAGAEQASQAAIRLDKTQAAAYLTRAQALSDLQRPEEALEALDTAQKMNPLLPQAQLIQLRGQIYRKQRRYRDTYNLFLDQVVERSGKRTWYAPAIAALNFVLSFFGQNAPAVLISVVIVLILLVLFGISKIPVAGGGIVDILVIALVGFLGWNAIQLSSGMSPLLKIRDTSAIALAGGALVLGIVVTFVLAWALGHFTTPAHHTNYWFNTITFGLAAVVGVIAGFAALNYSNEIMRRN